MGHSYKNTIRLVDEVEKEMLEGKKFKGLKTGFDRFDEAFQGFLPGELILVGGRPAMGKTGFAISLINNLCLDENKSCLYFTLGESPQMLMERIIEAVAVLDCIPMRVLSEDDEEEVKKVAQSIRESKIIIEGKSISIDKIREKCLEQSMREKPDFIVIDYLQMIYSKESILDAERMRSYVKRLRKTARLIQCPIILLTQLPRTIEERSDHRPMLSDLREYGLIEMYVDKVIFLYRDEYYDCNTDRRGVVDITVAKNKNGSIGTIELAHIVGGLMVSC